MLGVCYRLGDVRDGGAPVGGPVVRWVLVSGCCRSLGGWLQLSSNVGFMSVSVDWLVQVTVAEMSALGNRGRAGPRGGVVGPAQCVFSARDGPGSRTASGVRTALSIVIEGTSPMSASSTARRVAAAVLAAGAVVSAVALPASAQDSDRHRPALCVVISDVQADSPGRDNRSNRSLNDLGPPPRPLGHGHDPTHHLIGSRHALSSRIRP